MLYPDLIDIPTDSFGGYCPAIPPADLPPGAAVYAQDCEFPLAAVRSRGGLRNVFAAIAGNPAVNGLKSYITPTLAQRLMVWDASGKFSKESPQGTLGLVAQRPYPNLFSESVTLFGREYQAFFNSLGGFDIPRQYDDTNWDRVSQTGPGSAPSAAEENVNVNTVGSPNGLLNTAPAGLAIALVGVPGLSQLGLIVTVHLSVHFSGLLPGDKITIAGAGVAGYNGTWIVATANTRGGINGFFTFVSNVQGLANSGGGTVSVALTQVVFTASAITLTNGQNITISGAGVAGYNATWPVRNVSAGIAYISVAVPGLANSGGAFFVAGSIAAGLHQVSLAFVTRQGYITMAAVPPRSWTATGTRRVVVSDIATGSGPFSNVIARLLLFTPVITPPATTGPFYSLPTGSTQIPTSAMLIGDNTTTTVAVDFTDAVLISGFQANYLFTQVELGEPAFVIGYNSRLFWLGERNRVPNFVDPGFEGGFDAQSNPRGWISADTAGSLGKSEWETDPAGVEQNLSGGASYVITGDGVTAMVGLITQSAYQDYLGVPLIRTNTPYSVRVRLAKGGGLAQGTLHINLQSASFGGGGTPIVIPATALPWNPADLTDPYYAIGGIPGISIPCTPGQQITFAYVSGVIFGANVPPSFDGNGLGPGTTGGIHPWPSDRFGSTHAGVCCGAFVDISGVVLAVFSIGDNLTTAAAPAGTVAVTVGVNLVGNNYTTSTGSWNYLWAYGTSIPAGVTGGLAVAASQLAAGFTEFTATLTDVPLAIVPADLTLQVYADGTPTNLGQFFVDSIEPFPTNIPSNYSTARVSHAFNPESYDGVTGQVQVRPGDGQQLKAGFTLRSNLYLAKDHYLCYVTDDGINEPSAWPVNEVSSTIGICGPNAVASTEEWSCFAERSGVYLCWGADPVKISQEIDTDAANLGRPAWDLINWNAAHTIWVRIDQAKKRILIGAPINGATTPTIVFCLDYKWLNSAEEIASSDSVTYSSFTGKMLAHGRGRRWCVWNIAANSMCFAERSDGTAQPFFGNGVGNGKIYQQYAPNLQPSDDGASVNFRWRGYGCPSAEQEQGLQIGAGRKLMGYLKFRATGTGNLLLSAVTAQRTTTLRPYLLSANPAGDGERPININGERFYIEVGTNAVNAWAQVEKLIPYIRKSATMMTRGVTA